MSHVDACDVAVTTVVTCIMPLGRDELWVADTVPRIKRAFIDYIIQSTLGDSFWLYGSHVGLLVSRGAHLNKHHGQTFEVLFHRCTPSSLHSRASSCSCL